MQIYPAIDILDGKVVRLLKGDYQKVQVYATDPVDIAMQFLASQVKKLHIVDLEGAKKKKPANIELISSIKKKTRLSIQTGGGVRSLEDFQHILDQCLDVEKDSVMIGSLIFKNPKEFEKILALYKKNILLTVDVWDRNVKISGWSEDAKTDIFSFIHKIISVYGINRFLVTQIQRDGTLEGPDVDLYKEINDQFKGISIIASGGVSCMEDIRSLRGNSALEGVVVGKAYYEGKITLKDIACWQKENIQ